MPVLPVPEATAPVWIPHAPDWDEPGLSVYTDGSMRYGPSWILRRTGCALVVVRQSGDLVAYATATPPAYVRTAAAAELWCLWLVCAAARRPPLVLTDCMAVVRAAAAGVARQRSPSREHAHIWRLIADSGHDVAQWARTGRLVWVPAHGAFASVGVARRVDGGGL